MADIMVSVRAAHCILVIEFLLLLHVWQLYYHFYFAFICFMLFIYLKRCLIF